MKKLFNNIKNSFSGLNKVLSVSVNLNNSDSSLIGSVYAYKKELINSICEFKDLPAEDKKNLPVILTVEGKGVLNKFVSQALDKIKIRNVIPNIKEDDFYINYIPNQKGTWVCLVRKTVVEAILKENDIPFNNVIDLHIGVAQVQFLTEVFSPIPNQISDKILTFEGKNLTDTNTSENRMKSNEIFGNTVNHNLQLSFIGVLISYAMLNANVKQNVWTQNYSELKDKKTFTSTLKLCLGVLLLIFIGNLIVNTIANNKLNTLANTVSEVNNLVSKVDALESNVNLKDKFIKDLGLSINPQFAYYADQIGETVPENIQLSEILINPIHKSIRKKKLIEFKKEVISISGYCSSPQDCNNWVEEIRKLHWAKNVELQEFTINKDLLGTFTITINY